MSLLILCAALVAVTAALRARRHSVLAAAVVLGLSGAALVDHAPMSSTRLEHVAGEIEREARADTQLGVPYGPVVLGGQFGVVSPHGVRSVFNYSDKALGGFSSANYFASSTGSYIPFAPGSTLFVTFQTQGTVNSTWEDIISSTNGAGLGAAKGWWLARGGSDSGANAGYLTLISGAGGVRYFYSPPSTGITVLCLVWRASDNVLLVATNGGALTTLTALTPAAQDSSCLARVGQANAFAQALSTVRLLNYAVWSSEATSAQASALTYTTGDRYVLPLGVTSTAAQWAQFSSWTGGASFATSGSSAITYGVTGTPTLTKVAEVRYASSAISWWDSHQSLAETDGNGNAFLQHLSYARARFTTTAPRISVETLSTSLVANPQAETGLYDGGTWFSETAATDSVPYTTEIAASGSGSRELAVWEGPQILATAVSALPLGTFVQAVRFPTVGLDGTTAITTTPITRVAPQKRLGLLTNSIGVGFYATPMTENGLPALLRVDFPTTGTGGVTCWGAGLQSVKNIASTPTQATATATALLAELDGTSVNYLVGVSMETNDWYELQISAAAYQTYVGYLLAAIDATIAHAVPGFTFLWVSALDVYAPASPNGTSANSSGSTLAQMRAATAAAGAGYAWFTSLSGAGLVPHGDYYSDGVHLSTDAPLKTAIKTALGYSIAGGLPSNDNGTPALPIVSGAALVAVGAVVQRRRRAKTANDTRRRAA